MKIRQLGQFIRNQRKGARLSLKAVSAVAGVSIPYLSQIERGLRKPSADILQAIAKGLRISAETLYVQAGILDERATPDVAAAIMGDPTITERQKQALIQIYRAFQEDAGRQRGAARSRAIKGGTPRKHVPKRGGRVEPQAVRSPHPTSLRSPATKP